ncbi:putative Ig domain-containing protein, partial [Bradyrhizobium japonicum]|uniref:putative Ig domain-containing protein n=1 Tax=Bradyrhizobium japonicum TaxID=375 RepID=UPI00309FDE00
NPNNEPDLAGYKLSYGTQSGVYTTTIDVGKVTTYVFTPPPGKLYYVVVQAYNTAGELSAKSTEVTINIPLSNGPPTLTQPANKTSTLNSSTSMALSGSDPDGTPVSFSAAGLPPGVLINSASGLIAGSPSVTGTFQVVATVSDGALSASRT